MCLRSTFAVFPVLALVSACACHQDWESRLAVGIGSVSGASVFDAGAVSVDCQELQITAALDEDC